MNMATAINIKDTKEVTMLAFIRNMALLADAMLILSACTGIASTLNNPSTSAILGEPECGDFLAEMGLKPERLEFMTCARGMHNQLAVLRARYRVRGASAITVEADLARVSGMHELKLACCGWESLTGHGLVKHGPDSQPKEYGINMYSEESPYSSRDEWILIPWFYVDVELFLEQS